MKKSAVLLFTIFALILSACSNLPQAPTPTPVTPTLSPEEMMAAAQETAQAMSEATQTQWAIENPSPIPTDTATPEPEYTPTPELPPAIPPTATEKPLPYYSVSDTSYKVYPIGNPSDASYDFVPMDKLYVEVCYKNAGSAVWNTSYRCAVTNQGGGYITPVEQYLGREVANGEWACFSFQGGGQTDVSLGTHCPQFAMYTDGGVVITNGYASACWNIH